MKQAKTTTTTTQIEPENYALGLTKSQVNDLYVIYLVAVVVFIGILIAGTIGKAIYKIIEHIKMRRNMKELKQQLMKVAQQINNQQPKEGIN